MTIHYETSVMRYALERTIVSKCCVILVVYYALFIII